MNMNIKEIINSMLAKISGWDSPHYYDLWIEH